MAGRKRRPGVTQKNPKSLANLRQGPPAPKGNQLGLKHGAHARVDPARIEARMETIYGELADSAPVRSEDGDLPVYDRAVVRLLAEVLCRLETVRAWLDVRGGDVTRQGKVRSAARHAGRLRREAFEYMEALGMTPKARARLGVDLVRQRDLAKEWEQEDRAKRRRASMEGEAEDA